MKITTPTEATRSNSTTTTPLPEYIAAFNEAAKRAQIVENRVLVEVEWSEPSVTTPQQARELQARLQAAYRAIMLAGWGRGGRWAERVTGGSRNLHNIWSAPVQADKVERTYTVSESTLSDLKHKLSGAALWPRDTHLGEYYRGFSEGLRQAISVIETGKM